MLYGDLSESLELGPAVWWMLVRNPHQGSRGAGVEARPWFQPLDCDRVDSACQGAWLIATGTCSLGASSNSLTTTRSIRLAKVGSWTTASLSQRRMPCALTSLPPWGVVLLGAWYTRVRYRSTPGSVRSGRYPHYVFFFWKHAAGRVENKSPDSGMWIGLGGGETRGSFRIRLRRAGSGGAGPVCRLAQQLVESCTWL